MPASTHRVATSVPRGIQRPLSLAPMMDRTDRHFRFFLRQLTRHTLNYTEMVTTGAVLHGDRDRLLAFDEAEKPIALQLGGDDPKALTACVRIAADLGYDEVNLNVGCPSDRVQQGRFGACLMATPERVADAVTAMRAAVALPITVKHRIGIDDQDRYEDMLAFVDVVAGAACDRFSVHARKAWLQGLSPKQNREVPPLRYEEVYRLKRERPDLRIEINGGVRALDAAAAHLQHVDGVMIGRAAYEDPFVFAGADRALFHDHSQPAPSRREVIEATLPYAARLVESGAPVHRISRHLLGLFAGCQGAKAWRRTLSEGVPRTGAGIEVIQEAMTKVPPYVLDERPAA